MTEPHVPEILIVEDELLVAHDLQLSLERMGYGVSGVAATGEEALEAASQRRPDLVLMDVRLRGDRDGIETASLLRENYGLPIIYLTAYADDATLGRAKLTEPFAYVLKPWNPRELRSAVEIALYKHKIESRLRDRERWFSTTLGAIDDAVVAVGPDGAITFMNSGAEALLGILDDEARGRTVTDVMPLVDSDTGVAIPDLVKEAMAERRAVRLPSNAMLRDRAIEDSVAPIITDTGGLLGAVMVCRDATEHRQLLEEVARNDRLRALGTLAAGVGHEINNPLAHVHGNVGIALEEVGSLRAGHPGGAPDPARLEALAQVLEEAAQGIERIREIVSDLRTFARPSGEARAPIDLAGCAAWAIRVTAREVAARGRLTTNFGLTPLVLASEGRIGQVLVNLIVNAAHAIAETRPEAYEIWVTTRTDARGWAVVSVRDAGSGIAPEDRERIFEPFFSTKEASRGTGLGLAVSRSIVESLGGEIHVTSELGRGSTFEVSLPPAPAGSARSEAPQEEDIGAPMQGRVLVIDDEPLLRRMLVRALQGEHDVVTCSDGREALELLARDPSFDLILCDLNMPRMDGREVYVALRERQPETAARLVFSTGGSTDEETAAFLDTVPNEQISKPITLHALRSLVQRHLRQ